MFDAFTAVRVNIIGGTILKLLKTVKRYSQCVSVVNYLAMINLKAGQKWKGWASNRVSQLNK